MSRHLCHAIGCERVVPPRMLMCAPHWRMVPLGMQRAVWRTYRPGQERMKDPSSAYLDAAMAAVNAVARAESLEDS